MEGLIAISIAIQIITFIWIIGIEIELKEHREDMKK